MKFQIREGFIAHITTKVDLGDDKFQLQDHTYYGGQPAELTEEQAEQHAHKLAPKDKAAEAWLASKCAPVAPSAALGLSPENLALVQAMAAEMLKTVMASTKAAPAVTA